MLHVLNRVFTRILVLGLIALGALAVIGVFVLRESHDNLYAQKKADIRHVVETTVSLLSGLEKRVEAGQMTREQAQAEANRLITSIRYQGKSYLFVVNYDHVMVIHPTKPERAGKNLYDDKDPKGKHFIRDFVSVAKAGGGYVSYDFQLPQSTEHRDKISYVAPFKPWNWVVATGVLVDDVEAIHDRLEKSLLMSLGVIGLILLVTTFFVTRSIVGPINRLTGSLKRLAGGEIDADVAGAGRRDEFGAIARAVVGVRETVRESMQAQMQREEESNTKAEQTRRALLGDLAVSLDNQVKAVAESVNAAAQELLETAHSMQSVSDGARGEADKASQVSKVAADHAITVSQATKELDSAVAEIGSRVQESSKISQEAVTQIHEAGDIVRNLSKASTEIEKVVSLIQAIAEQTNLLALNATIEAARAGEAGRGFAIVASEVKTLASQTAKATEEISQQIEGITGATEKAVASIEGVDRTIARLKEIASTIAAAVEEQSAATSEIARAIGETTRQTESVSQSLDRLLDAAGNTNSSSQSVVDSAKGLSSQSASLKREVAEFVGRMQAA
jgi:methyl-accepting chemotaxis protein